jgi:hypothetical protein
MLNKKLLAIAIASVSLLSATSANANVNSPDAANLSSGVGSTVLLSVWDKTAQTSYTQVLETSTGSKIDLSNFLSTNSFAGETLSSSNWTLFAASANFAADNIVYTIQAGSSISSGANAASFGLVSTIATTDTAAALASLKTTVKTAANVTTFDSKLNTYIGNTNTGLGATASDNFATSTSSWYAGAPSALQATNAVLGNSDIASVAVGSFANFFYASFPTTKDAYLGAWDLTVTGGVGSLSYAAAGSTTAPVPVPGAVWFMLSGLVGLFSVSRRNKAA